MKSKRWEDVTPIWKGPNYDDLALRYAASVQKGFLSGGLITCIDVVDWSGQSTRDLLLSSWDACYGGQTLLRRETGRNTDGTPALSPPKVLEGITGYVTSVPDENTFHLLSASRLRRTLYFYQNVGICGDPQFGAPVELGLDCDWVKSEREIIHLARFVDIDGDGEKELVVGTDYWDDYWPNGIEWNEHGYRGFDAADRWLGGPLRGFVYVFKNSGSLREPVLTRGVPLRSNDIPIEVYGQLAPTFGDFRGMGECDLVCGEFQDILHFLPNEGGGKFGDPTLLADSTGDATLAHCIHFPCAVDWNGNGKTDLLVGSEDGYISLLKNVGSASPYPVFKSPARLETEHPALHASVLPVPAAHDWNGNGLPDLVVGNSGGELLFYRNIGEPGRPEFDREVMLTAGGAPIRVMAGPTGSIQGPSESKFGYTCPTVADWSQDGHPDILMSDITGYHRLYKNMGGEYPPKFDAAQPLNFNGAWLKTVWRVRPAVVDWLGNGQLSYVTLDERGMLATYGRDDDINLADKRTLHWENGRAIEFTEDIGGGLGRIKLCACDWTGDGRLDLIIGTHGRASVPPGPDGMPRHTTHQAAVLLLENIGSNSAPTFAPPTAICYKHEPIAAGMHACSPEAFFNGQGEEPDLLLGVEDGSIVLFPRADLSW